MLDALWSLIWWIVYHIPWLLMGLAAGMAYSKQRKSLPLLLETVGGIGYFLLAMASWLVFKLLYWTHASYSIISPVTYVFNFLDVVALWIFAVGFCWEKFRAWRAAPSAVSAFPVG